MICIHPVASAILIVDYPTNPGQEEDEKVALFEVLNIGRAGIGCFHIFVQTSYSGHVMIEDRQ